MQVLLLILVLYGAITSNLVLADPCRDLLSRRSLHRDWSEEYRKLRYEMNHRNEFITKHLVPEGFITAVGKNFDQVDATREGAGSWGVIRVETKEGPMALKFLSVSPESRATIQGGFEEMRIIDEAILQHAFGELDIGLPMKGILDSAAVEALMKRHPEIKQYEYSRHNGSSQPQWAFLTPLIEDAYNPKKRQMDWAIQPLPAHASSWNPERLKSWFQEVSEVLTRLEVRGYDVQVLIDKNGHPYLMDVGAYLVFDVANGNPGKNRSMCDSYNEGILSKLSELIALAHGELGKNSTK